ncbi:hypothetical protein ATE47_07700 [Chryseobacterium sp. IHB B 17019]|uniref:hypothetical protein n=1 Tax=Chryseobacterium sp. IHB B 17019 TaxID=1721091 RepID=UPI0007203297|nr:hypothetical protein [Chryseobacterium sp. IHB B 17019]ALR30415.1 hypothetical protein ATE47_07700 [Chryseobacterium sp. IHB B 17019]
MRKHLSLFIIAGVLSVTVISCMVNEKKRNSENKIAASGQDHLTLEFTGTESFNIKNPKFKVSLYGSDPNLMDVKATLITEKEFEQKSVPFTIDLPIPKNPESLINPKPVNGVKYYVTTEWDSDGNGKTREKGDIFIDYDKKFPNVELNNQTQKIYLKILK